MAYLLATCVVLAVRFLMIHRLHSKCLEHDYKVDGQSVAGILD